MVAKIQMIIKIFSFQKKQRKFQLETEKSNSKYADMERAERQARIDIENLQKKQERFRNRVVQVTFSTPGIRAPSDEISDDALMETLKKVIFGNDTPK